MLTGLGLTYLDYWLLSSVFPLHNMPKEQGMEVMKALTQGETTLIGLWGIIVVYMLSSMNNFRSQTISQWRQNIDKSRTALYRYDLAPPDSEKKKELKKMLDDLEKDGRYYNELVEGIDKTIRAESILSVMVFVFFIGSLMATILGLGKITETGLDIYYLSWSLDLLFIALILMPITLLLHEW